MNKVELVSKVAEKLDITKKDTATILDTVLDTITEAIASGDSVNIAGFGKFEVSTRAARTCRNPQTGELIDVAASKAPKFKPAKALKDSVNA